MNKKGGVNVGLGAILVIGLIIVLAFVFSTTVRYVVFGLGSFAIAFIVLSNQKIKDNVRTPVFLVFLGIGVFLILTSGVLQSISGSRYVEVPFFATIECQRGLTSSFQATIPSDGEWFYKDHGLPENTDSWNIMIKTPDEGFFTSATRLEYYICNSRSFCSNRKLLTTDSNGDITNIGNIDSDKFIWIQYQSGGITGWKGQDRALLEVTYQPFKLMRDDPLRGGRQEINTVGCLVPTSDVGWLNRIISFSGSSNIDEYTGDNRLEVGEIINYISGDIVAVSEGNTQSNGWCIYENGQASIYEIEEITYGSGTSINRVNLDNRIGIDECCDGEVYPNNKICQNGEFVQIEDAECTRRSDCGTIEFFPTSSSTVGRYDCISEKCEIVDEKVAECTSNQQCRTNEYCSRNTFTCTLSSETGGEGEETQDTCITNADCLNGQFCDDNVCKIVKEDDCEWYQEEYTSVTKDYGNLYWRAYTPFVDPIETPVSGCKTASWINLLVIGGVVLVLGGYAVSLTTKRRKRK